MGKKPVIEFRNFSFQYKTQKNPTLKNIDLTIYEGEKVLIIGPSGCGKSTLINAINGLIPFSYKGNITGNLLVNGRETRELSIFALSKEIGTVLQDADAQFVGLSVGEDIAFTMENEMVPRDEMLANVEQLAGVVDMNQFINNVPFNLSGGQKQKTALAGVLGDKVNVLLFDEPLAALDPQMGLTAISLIDDIHRFQNKTVVIVEHRLEDVLNKPIDRVILMDQGSIVADTTVAALLRSNMLAEHGIREPLYITAMKYAGCDLKDNDTIGDIESLKLSSADMMRFLKFYKTPVEMPELELGEEVISVENVSFAYNPALNDVIHNASFKVRKGERIAIIGKNGAGKSTMAKLLTGVIKPNQGCIYLNNRSLKNMKVNEIGEQLGLVMQSPNQMIVKDTIKDEVELGLRIRKLPKDEIKTRTEEALKCCGLYSLRKWPVDSVSYGQKKRITMASILALGPDILVFDEPTAGQDYRHYMDMLRYINRLNTKYGKTILFITHNMHLAIQHTDRAIVFADSEIIADDSIYNILSDDTIIARASLKQTSLYLLAQKMELNPDRFIKHFIAYERMVKAHE